MGWLTFHETRTAKQYFTDKFKDSTDFELVDIAIVSFRTAYLAVKDLKNNYTFCMIYLLHRAPKSYYNFGYKDMSEFAGPGVTECPIRILNKLTPLKEIERISPDIQGKPFEWASEWRENCRKNALEKTNRNKTLQKGKILKTKDPILFNSGNYYQYFIKKGRQFLAIVNYNTEYQREIPVRLRGWKFIEFEFI